MEYETQVLIEVGRQCRIAFECDESAALEGFSSEFQSTVSAYMTALSEINEAIPAIIAKGDVNRLRSECERAIRICGKFKEELKKLPLDKIAAIRNLMPCFKSLVAVMSIVMVLGGAKKVANMPQLAPVVSKLATVDKLPPIIKTAIYGRLPVLRKMIVKDDTSTGKLGKLFNATANAGNVIRNVTKIIGNIKEVLNDSKYAKMLSEEDAGDQNVRNRKYAAMLGQINDMIAIYQKTRDSAKDIIAEANQQISTSKAEESLVLLAAPFCTNLCNEGVSTESAIETYCTLVSNAYVECALESALDIMPIAQRYTILLSEITKEIPEALREGDNNRVIRLCKQGIHTCERCKDELRALPPDRFAKVRNFIPSYELLLSIWLIFEAGVMAKQKKLYTQSGRALKDMGENGAFLVKLLAKVGLAHGTDAEIDEAFALAISIWENSPQFVYRGNAGTGAAVLTAVRRGLRPVLVVINAVYQFVKESEYAKYLEDSDYSDPNIGNRKYRALIGELNQMIIMFTCIMNDVPGYMSAATETDVTGDSPEIALSVYVQKCVESNAVFIPNTNRSIYTPFLVYPSLPNGKSAIDAYIRSKGIQSATIRQMFGMSVGVVEDFGKPIAALMAVKVGKRPIGYYNESSKDDAVRQVNISDIPGIIDHFFSKDCGLSPIVRRQAIIDAAKVVDEVSKKYPRLEAGISPDTAIRNDYSDTLDEPFIFAGEKMSLYVCSIEDAPLQLGENPETDNDESEEVLYDMAEQWLLEIEKIFNKTKSGKLFKIHTWWDHTDLHIDLCVRTSKGNECWLF